MKPTRSSVVRAAICLMAVVSATAAWASQTGTLDYDSFMQQDLKTRLATFKTLSAEAKAEIMGTHIQRWVEANRDTLTPDQLAMTREWQAFAKAENYRTPLSDEQSAVLKDIESRSETLFSKDQIREALTIHATYIPKGGLK